MEALAIRVLVDLLASCDNFEVQGIPGAVHWI